MQSEPLQNCSCSHSAVVSVYPSLTVISIIDIIFTYLENRSLMHIGRRAGKKRCPCLPPPSFRAEQQYSKHSVWAKQQTNKPTSTFNTLYPAEYFWSLSFFCAAALYLHSSCVTKKVDFWWLFLEAYNVKPETVHPCWKPQAKFHKSIKTFI